MDRTTTWTPQTMAEALRQGREWRPTLRDRVERAVGLDALRSRRVRRLWQRWMPYVVVGSVLLASLSVAAIKVL